MEDDHIIIELSELTVAIFDPSGLQLSMVIFIACALILTSFSPFDADHITTGILLLAGVAVVSVFIVAIFDPSGLQLIDLAYGNV